MLAALGIDAEHLEVAREAAGADAPVEAPARHQIQLGDALREHHVGARNVLPLRREVLPDPRLLVAEPVERRQLLEIVVHRVRRIRPRRMQRHREIAETHRDPPP
jgi:hypothetical protein